jgi:hypothetical protein
MLEVGDGAFLAENVMEASATVERGELHVKKVKIGHHTFIGNTTYVSIFPLAPSFSSLIILRLKEALPLEKTAP